MLFQDHEKTYRSRENRIFAGIIGGLGEYFEVDPVLLRLTWLLAAGLTGFMPGFIVYFLAIFIVPVKPAV